jgi:hypothetical protein
MKTSEIMIIEINVKAKYQRKKEESNENVAMKNVSKTEIIDENVSK